MLYSNVEFLVFFAAVFVLLFAANNSPNIKLWVLALSSVIFYIWAGLGDFLVFFFVVFISWIVVWCAEQTRFSRTKDLVLLFGIALLTINLFFWKYFTWITQTIQSKYPLFLYDNKIEVILPVGVSFFTLQGLAYLIDYRRGQVGYLTFQQVFVAKSFFPQLIAGPIVRMQHLVPQLYNLNRLKSDDIQNGLAIFLLGFFKKIAIADRMGGIVDPVFNDPSVYTVGSIMLALVAYTIQIWADFSGYTDMGRGVAKMIGINLPENFLSPYLAKSPSEFWRRWHITLSQWIRGYIYLPMGGSRGNVIRVLFVLVVTMGISGLWHGAAITFIIWGLYHGLLLVIERACRSMSLPIFDKNYSIFLMLALIMLGWLFFRVQSLDSLEFMLRAIITWTSLGKDTVSPFVVLLGASVCSALHIIFYKPLVGERRSIWDLINTKINKMKIYQKQTGICISATFLGVFMVLTLLLRVENGGSGFIYFQF